jgi:hypothetical protein
LTCYFQFLPAESAEIHVKPYSNSCLCRISYQAPPDYKSIALPLRKAVQYNCIFYRFCLHQVSRISKIFRNVSGYGTYFIKLRIYILPISTFLHKIYTADCFQMNTKTYSIFSCPLFLIDTLRRRDLKLN